MHVVNVGMLCTLEMLGCYARCKCWDAMHVVNVGMLCTL